jgi:aspartyl protease family protein
MFGWAVRQAVLWSLLGLLFYVVIDHLPTLQRPAEQSQAPAASAMTAQPRRGSPNSEVFRADSRGHVVLDAFVNSSPVRFLVDTGATMVVLTQRDAAAAGIGPGDLVFNMRTQTANGVARAAQVRLREVRIGQLAVNDVPAWVAENLNVSLLGQSFLTRLDSYEMRDGALTLNWY